MLTTFPLLRRKSSWKWLSLWKYSYWNQLTFLLNSKCIPVEKWHHVFGSTKLCQYSRLRHTLPKTTFIRAVPSQPLRFLWPHFFNQTNGICSKLEKITLIFQLLMIFPFLASSQKTVTESYFRPRIFAAIMRWPKMHSIEVVKSLMIHWRSHVLPYWVKANYQTLICKKKCKNPVEQRKILTQVIQKSLTSHSSKLDPKARF